LGTFRNLPCLLFLTFAHFFKMGNTSSCSSSTGKLAHLKFWTRHRWSESIAVPFQVHAKIIAFAERREVDPQYLPGDSVLGRLAAQLRPVGDSRLDMQLGFLNNMIPAVEPRDEISKVG
jgi:hypothetical protein